MKKLTGILSIIFIVGCFSVMYSQTERIAIIEDSSGLTTEVENLSSNLPPSLYYYQNRICVDTETASLIIPIENLISIMRSDDTKNKVFLIDYYWSGEKRTITGSLTYGNFTGKSDFGVFTMYRSDVKQLTFNKDSEKSGEVEEFQPEGFILFKNGNQVEFKDLRRSVSYVVSQKVFIDDAIRTRYTEELTAMYPHPKTIQFKRGTAQVELEFKDIKSIEIRERESPGYPITITLKNGKSTPGFLKTGHSAREKGMDAVTGLLEYGEFWVGKDDIKAIHFYE